ncbi:MAG: hypothetical protein HWE07_09115 [Cytophagia bacterium]|nr:hypothetical protein [Cytophagia bacterium]
MKNLLIATLFVSVLSISCEQKNTQTDDEKAVLTEQAKTKFREALAAGKSSKYWVSLDLWQQTEELYDQIDDDSQNQFRYYLNRNKANILDKVGLQNLATEAMQTAIEWLKKSDELPQGKNYELELISSQRYLATYMRDNGNFEDSNKIFFQILSSREAIPGIHAQIKNLIGMNFMDLGDYESAFYQFDDILKIDEMETKLKAHYLQNRGKAAFHIGKKLQAFSDLNEAANIDASMERDRYEFEARLDLGEIYLMDKQFNRALEQFNKALMLYDYGIEENPDFFKIYNLKYAAELATGHPLANDTKIKFDQLTRHNELQKQQYTAEQELALLQAGLFSVNQQLQRREYLVTHWPRWVSYTLIFFILVVLFRTFELTIKNTQIIQKTKA